MKRNEIAKHIDQTIEEEEKKINDQGDEVLIETVPLCKKALVHDTVQFDLNALDFLHKLGEGNYTNLFSLLDWIMLMFFFIGGFGTVRACKFRQSSLEQNCTNSPSTAASTSFIASDDEHISNTAAAAEESKFVR